MATEGLPSFDETQIQQTLESVKSHQKPLVATDDHDDGIMKTAAASCITVTVNNGQVCLNIPIYGSVCLPVPSWVPNGTAASACVSICTKWGIPCGVQVTVSVGGQPIIQKGFGCSC